MLISLQCGVPNNGCAPLAGLADLGDGFLYGTTSSGGINNGGTVFKIAPDGSGLAILKAFENCGMAHGGCNPQGKLIVGGDRFLYGTTHDGGGADAQGTVFKIGADGTKFAVLKVFHCVGADGCTPAAGLLQGRDGFLYGTTKSGRGGGTVFKLAPDGSRFTLLKAFDGPASPFAELVLASDGLLYGTTYQGGARNQGSVFSLATDGTGFTLVDSFACDGNDGCHPTAALILAEDGNLYGTTRSGGLGNAGTLYRVRFSHTSSHPNAPAPAYLGGVAGFARSSATGIAPATSSIANITTSAASGPMPASAAEPAAWEVGTGAAPKPAQARAGLGPGKTTRARAELTTAALGAGAAGEIAYFATGGTEVSGTPRIFDNGTNIGIGGIINPVTTLHVAYDGNTVPGVYPRGILSDAVDNTAHSAHVGGRKARGTRNSLLPVQAGDYMSSFVAEGYDGSKYLETGYLAWRADGTVAPNKIPSAMVLGVMDANGAEMDAFYISGLYNNNVKLRTNVEDLNIISGGTGVGIGADSVGSVDAPFVVKKTAAGSGQTTLVNISNNFDSNFRIGVSNTGESDKRAIVGPTTPTDLVLQTGGMERLRLTSAGSVRLAGLASNGFLRTSGSNGTVTVDTSSYASTSNSLSVFAATSSAQLAGVLSDETGSGAAVFAAGPSLSAPTLSSPAITGQITLPVSRTTMTGNIALGASASSYQFFDANGADREIGLPSAVAGMSFVVYNYGTANNLTLKDAVGNLVTIISFGNRFATVIFDGIAWRVF